MIFEVTVQSPFKQTPHIYPNCSSEQAQQLFNAIDWKALWQAIMDSGSSQESDYYYYEVSYQNNLGEQFILHIGCTVGENVCVAFFRPKTITKKVWFKEKEVFEPRYGTECEEVSVQFAYNCLMAFLNENNVFLENNILGTV